MARQRIQANKKGPKRKGAEFTLTTRRSNYEEVNRARKAKMAAEALEETQEDRPDEEESSDEEEQEVSKNGTDGQDSLDEENSTSSVGGLPASVVQTTNNTVVSPRSTVTNDSSRKSIRTMDGSRNSIAMEQQQSSAHAAGKDQMQTLVKKFTSTQLFRQKKYLTKDDMEKESRSYQAVCMYLGIEPSKVNPAMHELITDTLRETVGSRRSTVVDAIRKKYMGK